MIDEDQLTQALTPALVQQICDRHRGAGSDGILLAGAMQNDVINLRIYNPDGSEAEKSGNGLRIFSRYLWDVKRAGDAPFFVQTAGGQGVHGKAFGTTSKVYAASLIAAPVFSDRTKDVIFARTIFSTENQVTKEPSSQIGITWDIAFE